MEEGIRSETKTEQVGEKKASFGEQYKAGLSFVTGNEGIMFSVIKLISLVVGIMFIVLIAVTVWFAQQYSEWLLFLCLLWGYTAYICFRTFYVYRHHNLNSFREALKNSRRS